MDTLISGLPWKCLSDSVQYQYKFYIQENGFYTLLVTDFKRVWMDQLDSLDTFKQRLMTTSSNTFYDQPPDKLKSRICRIIDSNQGLHITVHQDTFLLSIQGEAVDYIAKDGSIKKYMVPFPFTFSCPYQVDSNDILYHQYILPSQYLISFLLESNDELKKRISKRDESIASLTDKLRDSGVNGKLYNISKPFDQSTFERNLFEKLDRINTQVLCKDAFMTDSWSKVCAFLNSQNGDLKRKFE